MKCNIPLFKYLFLLKDSIISPHHFFSLLCKDVHLCCYCSCAIHFYSFSVMFMSSQYLTTTSSCALLFFELLYKLFQASTYMDGCSQSRINVRLMLQVSSLCCSQMQANTDSEAVSGEHSRQHKASKSCYLTQAQSFSVPKPSIFQLYLIEETLSKKWYRNGKQDLILSLFCSTLRTS